MPRKKQSTKTIEVPNVPPASRMERNRPHPPTTLQVCGTPIKVINGKAQEADPKVLRARRREALRKRGEREGKVYDVDETRI